MSQSFYSPGFEEVASEDLEPSEELDQPCFEEAVEDPPSEENSEVLDVISSEELDLFSEDEPSQGYGRGQGALLSEESDLISSEEEASPGDAEELSEECEELLSEEEQYSGPEPEALLVQQ